MGDFPAIAMLVYRRVRLQDAIAPETFNFWSWDWRSDSGYGASRLFMASQLGMPGRSGLFPGKVHRWWRPRWYGEVAKKNLQNNQVVLWMEISVKFPGHWDPCKDFFLWFPWKIERTIHLSGSFRFQVGGFFGHSNESAASMGYGLNQQAIVCFFWEHLTSCWIFFSAKTLGKCISCCFASKKSFFEMPLSSIIYTMNPQNLHF